MQANPVTRNDAVSASAVRSPSYWHVGEKPVIPRSVLFAGCARNCAQMLPQVLRNVGRIADMFSKVSYLFVENDSNDDTNRLLNLWCSAHPSAAVMSLDGLAACCPVRTMRLEIARNQYLSIARNKFSHYDYLLVLDCDEANSADI